jgi:hypothetical protein
MRPSSPVTMPPSDAESTFIASKFTVRQYRDATANKDRDAVAEAIRRRFTERYVDPVLNGKNKHGFTQMAISCLMLEALESFLRGWKKSIRKSENCSSSSWTASPTSRH